MQDDGIPIERGRARPPQGEGPKISPRGGPPATEVAVRMEGLPANTGMVIGFGAPRAGYEWVGRAETDANGSLSATVEVPASAEENESHYFFVTLPERPPLGTSEAFHVTRSDGTLVATGGVTGEEGEFTAMRGDLDELYCLIGNVAALEPGTRVTIEGRIADPSTCQEGVPVLVEAARADR